MKSTKASEQLLRRLLVKVVDPFGRDRMLE